VRICGTSLNTRKCKLTFSKKRKPTLKWKTESKYANIPFAVFNKFNHSTLISNNRDFRGSLGPGPLAKEAVKVKSLDDYQKLAKKFAQVSKKNYKKIKEDKHSSSKFQQFYF
jgi:hypothetical protein